jgi:DNA-binding response OmpR family regulator
MPRNALLAFGNFKRSEHSELDEVAREAALELVVIDGAKEAAAWLGQNSPKVVLVDGTSKEAEELCLGARSQLDHAQTPIVVLNRALDELSFAEAFSWGGDDALEAGAPRRVLSRIRALPKEAASPPSSLRGVAIVADADRARRLVRARVLRNAGYRIQFSVSAEEMLHFATNSEPRLILADAEMIGAVEAMTASAKANPRILHVLLGAPRQLSDLATKLAGNDNCVLTDGFAPPENVVFLANEHARGGANDKRGSRRLLYGTRVTFQGEGRDAADLGYCYNISDGGLYVRTLAPPDDEYIWVELQPPRSDRRVRLEGQIVWRRRFGPSETATVPPGFGVRIVDGTAKSLAAWKSGYHGFAAALGAA